MAGKSGRPVQPGNSHGVRPAYIQQKEDDRDRQRNTPVVIPEGSFQCEACRNIFAKDKSDEEVMAQAKKDYPNDDMSDAVLLCATCYTAIAKRTAHIP
jgi:hypothetical protein